MEGEAVAMAPANTTHAAIQAELCRLIANALLANGAPCSVFTEPGVIPRVFAHENVRAPDLAVTCGDYKTERRTLAEPVVLIEILSPSNEDRTRYNVWAYTSIPSVAEIALFHTDQVGVELWRRLPDGNWPEAPVRIEAGELSFASIGVCFSRSRTPIARRGWRPDRRIAPGDRAIGPPTREWRRRSRNRPASSPRSARVPETAAPRLAARPKLFHCPSTGAKRNSKLICDGADGKKPAKCVMPYRSCPSRRGVALTRNRPKPSALRPAPPRRDNAPRRWLRRASPAPIPPTRPTSTAATQNARRSTRPASA